MSKHVFILALLPAILSLSIASFVSAQSIWEWQNPPPQGNTLTDVDVFNGNIAAACGDNATIIHSTDAGSTWDVVALAGGSAKRLNGVCVINSSIISAVGNDGTILRSDDGGASWTLLSTGVTSHLNGVDFYGSSFGVTVGNGGTILISPDAGETWNAASSGVADNLHGICVLDASTAVAVGSGGRVIKTEDGGLTWLSKTSHVTARLKAVHFTDTLSGIAVGTGPSAIGTANGGETWAPLGVPSIPPGFYASLEAVWMIDASNVVAVGTFETDMSEEYGWLLRSNNGGLSWDWNTLGDFLYGIAMFETNDGLAVGAAGAIRRVTAGLSWPRVGGAEKKFLAWAVDFTGLSYGVVAVSDAYNYMGGASRMYYTSDGGSTWDYTEIFARQMIDVAFADALTVYAVGRGWPTMDEGAAIFRSDDGGERWGAIYITVCAPDGTGCEYYFSEARAVDFAGPDFGVAVGTGGAIVCIINEGPCHIDPPTGADLNGVSVPSSEAVYAVGNNGVIIKGTSSGTVWTPQTSGVSVHLKDAAFADDLTGWAVGDMGTILRTLDGGVGWLPQSSGTTANLNSVSCFDASTAVITAGTTLLKTVDGGTTWVPEPTPCSMRDAVLIDIANVEAAGGYEGIIARRDAPIPVLFQQFFATASGQAVHLSWDIWSDVPIEEFRLYRSDGRVSGIGSLIAIIDPMERSYSDKDIRPGTEYQYMLAAVGRDGRETWSQEISAQMPVMELALLQNHPNPFNPYTMIRFRIPERMHVELGIYDVTGRHIRTLINAPCKPGETSLEWDGRDFSGNPVSSGIYFYRLKAGSKMLSKKMVLLR
jgi:photosystem II stability/assembly factor-like uncharacterized protein